jgi:hypothetical protein
MKTKLLLVLAALSVAACGTPEKQQKPKYNKVYEPEVGIVCDRVEQGCYDGAGPNLAGTQKYLGPEAAETFRRYLDRVGVENIKSIKFSDGVTCSYKSKLCYKAKFPDQVAPHHTKAMFGEY